jgi:hypothetical protein
MPGLLYPFKSKTPKMNLKIGCISARSGASHASARLFESSVIQPSFIGGGVCNMSFGLPCPAPQKSIVLDGDVRKPNLERAGSLWAPRALNRRVQHEVFLHSPSKSPASPVGRDSRRLKEIRAKTDQNHRTEAVKTGFSGAKTTRV